MPHMLTEYAHIYTVTFRCNAPPKPTRPPRGAEEGRALITYAIIKFREGSGVRRLPEITRRFRKLNIEDRIQIPESA